jgi:rubredoxin
VSDRYWRYRSHRGTAVHDRDGAFRYQDIDNGSLAPTCRYQKWRMEDRINFAPRDGTSTVPAPTVRIPAEPLRIPSELFRSGVSPRNGLPSVPSTCSARRITPPIASTVFRLDGTSRPADGASKMRGLPARLRKADTATPSFNAGPIVHRHPTCPTAARLHR